jgi:hypothetical protein
VFGLRTGYAGSECGYNAVKAITFINGAEKLTWPFAMSLVKVGWLMTEQKNRSATLAVGTLA